MKRRVQWWKVILIGAVTTVVHFIITFMAMMAVMYSALGPLNWLGNVLVSVFIPLGFPATFIIGHWTDGVLALPNHVTLAIMLGSSALWGTAVALLWRWWYGHRRDSQSAGKPAAPALRRSYSLTRAIVVACVVAFAHLVAQAGAWIEWDRALRPGELPHMPALWPIVSFPVFTLYEMLTGDRAMFGTFWWVVLGNSAAWGFAGGIAYRMLSTRRPSARVSETA